MMPPPTDNAKAALVLTSRLADAGARPLSATEWAGLVSRFADAQLGPAAVFEVDFDPQRVLHLDASMAERVATLLQARTSVAFELDRLLQLGVWTVSTEDAAYPARMKQALGSLAPPVLFGAGEAELLARASIGVVGSRDVSPRGSEFAGLVAEAAVRHGHGLVSGAARGVDQVAMNASFAAEGNVIGVLADSLEARIRKRDVRHALLGGRSCLITPFHPGAGFSVGAAMGRNKIVYGLARLVVVVATAAESGGTWAGATEALAKDIAPVAVWRGPGEGLGNAALEARGAAPVKSIDDVFSLVDDGVATVETDPEQLGIFDDSPPS
jgi:predicted Rossmann fold nucleotide-binding protein DprA/Smf involved in DNA uptake